MWSIIIASGFTTIASTSSAIIATYLINSNHFKFHDVIYFLLYAHVTRLVADSTILGIISVIKNCRKVHSRLQELKRIETRGERNNRTLRSALIDIEYGESNNIVIDNTNTVYLHGKKSKDKDYKDEDNNNIKEDKVIIRLGNSQISTSRDILSRSFIENYDDGDDVDDVDDGDNDTEEYMKKNQLRSLTRYILTSDDIYFSSIHEYFLYVLPFVLNVIGGTALYFSLITQTRTHDASIVLSFVCLYQVPPIIHEFWYKPYLITYTKIAGVTCGILSSLVLSLNGLFHTSNGFNLNDFLLLFFIISVWGLSTIISSGYNKHRNIPSRLLADLTVSAGTTIICLFIIVITILSNVKHIESNTGSTNLITSNLKSEIDMGIMFLYSWKQFNVLLLLSHLLDFLSTDVVTVLLAIGDAHIILPINNLSGTLSAIVSIFLFSEQITFCKIGGIILGCACTVLVNKK
jgi:hypothetical protein